MDKNIRTNLYLFNQRYLGKASYFVKGTRENFNPVYNEVIKNTYSSYPEFLNAGKKNSIKKEWYKKNIQIEHVLFESFDELSINQEIPWEPTTAIIFDSWQLHCSQNFRLAGAKWKVGLSLVFLNEV